MSDLALAVSRELTAEDLDTPAQVKQESVLTSLRNTHHMAAKLVAEGRSNIETGLHTGYAPGYISTLKSDPMFAELVAHYRAQVGQQYVDVHARSAGFMLNLQEVLQRRLEEDESKFSNKFLLEAFDTMGKHAVKPEAGQTKAPIAVNISFGTKPASPAEGGAALSAHPLDSGSVVIEGEAVYLSEDEL